MKSDGRHQLGLLGEGLASRHLEGRGLAVLDRNFRTRRGELDLVASDERYLVFCEVKTRLATGERALAAGRATRPLGPLAGIGARKRRQVRAMAREWLATRGAGGPRPPELRFDAIGITLDRTGRLVRLEHLEDAF